MCFHESILDATELPASKSRKGWFLTVKCAAAARPTGPAPIMATGRTLLLVIFSAFAVKDDGLFKRRSSQEKKTA